MKKGLRQLLRWPAGLLVGGALATVIGYNTWSYCCGGCTRETLLEPGPTGWTLFGATALTGTAWLALRWNNSRRSRRIRCRCGRDLRPVWIFCPQCGEERRSKA